MAKKKCRLFVAPLPSGVLNILAFIQDSVSKMVASGVLNRLGLLLVWVDILVYFFIGLEIGIRENVQPGRDIGS